MIYKSDSSGLLIRLIATIFFLSIYHIKIKLDVQSSSTLFMGILPCLEHGEYLFRGLEGSKTQKPKSSPALPIPISVKGSDCLCIGRCGRVLYYLWIYLYILPWLEVNNCNQSTNEKVSKFWPLCVL